MITYRKVSDTEYEVVGKEGMLGTLSKTANDLFYYLPNERGIHHIWPASTLRSIASKLDLLNRVQSKVVKITLILNKYSKKERAQLAHESREGLKDAASPHQQC